MDSQAAELPFSYMLYIACRAALPMKSLICVKHALELKGARRISFNIPCCTSQQPCTEKTVMCFRGHGPQVVQIVTQP